jgi:hypothetical protein
MTAEQLQQGADWVIRAFYSPWRIARRSLRWLRAPAGPARIAYPLVINAAYYGRVVRFGIRGRDPAHNRGAWLGHLRHSVRVGLFPLPEHKKTGRSKNQRPVLSPQFPETKNLSRLNHTNFP